MPGASLCCAQGDSVTESFDKMLLRELLGFCFENLVTVNSRILLLNVKSGVIQSELAGSVRSRFHAVRTSGRAQQANEGNSATIPVSMVTISLSTEVTRVTPVL